MGQLSDLALAADVPFVWNPRPSAVFGDVLLRLEPELKQLDVGQVVVAEEIALPIALAIIRLGRDLEQ